MKIIAFYLPQYHTFPENDRWWGKGFTEWTNVKKAVPSYKGHYQPRIPLNKNYYNLLNNSVLRWQADLAKKYGIYGFCYYHYWFDGHMLMEKPMENMLADKSVDLPFCICWANENWTKAWAKKSKEVLISQTYGDENEWKEHFNYLLPFFKDNRYIKVDGKPLFVIYRPEIVPCLEDMVNYWQSLARQNDFPGISFMYQQTDYDHRKEKTGYLFDYGIEYQPAVVRNRPQKRNLFLLARKALNEFVNYFHLPQTSISTFWYSYDDAWRKIIKMKPKDEKMVPGAFVDWDNTARYGKKASVYKGVTPEKFRKYLSMQIKHAKQDYKKDMIFMFAWNEWGEGGYLEPDEKYGYKMLKAVSLALKDNGEWPVNYKVEE